MALTVLAWLKEDIASKMLFQSFAKHIKWTGLWFTSIRCQMMFWLYFEYFSIISLKLKFPINFTSHLVIIRGSLCNVISKIWKFSVGVVKLSNFTPIRIMKLSTHLLMIDIVLVHGSAAQTAGWWFLWIFRKVVLSTDLPSRAVRFFIRNNLEKLLFL